MPIEERPTDVFFAGSVEHRGLPAQAVGAQDAVAEGDAEDGAKHRRPAAGAAGRHEDHKRLRCLGGLLTGRLLEAPDGRTRVSCAARASVETFRVLEGLRAGCVVVGEPLPDHWFYAGAPVIGLERWVAARRNLERVLNDPEELRSLHRASLSWWRDRCSEEAVGRLMANRLNDLQKA